MCQIPLRLSEALVSVWHCCEVEACILQKTTIPWKSKHDRRSKNIWISYTWSVFSLIFICLKKQKTLWKFWEHVWDLSNNRGDVTSYLETESKHPMIHFFLPLSYTDKTSVTVVEGGSAWLEDYYWLCMLCPNNLC